MAQARKIFLTLLILTFFREGNVIAQKLQEIRIYSYNLMGTVYGKSPSGELSDFFPSNEEELTNDTDVHFSKIFRAKEMDRITWALDKIKHCGSCSSTQIVPRIKLELVYSDKVEVYYLEGFSAQQIYSDGYLFTSGDDLYMILFKYVPRHQRKGFVIFQDLPCNCKED
jgi:hypothetical protein